MCSISRFPMGFEFDWHRDYRYGRQVERSFAGTLNIRDTAVVSDIKYVWEPSRFQHLSALAFAANAEQHADYIVRSIDSWLDANPYLYGVQLDQQPGTGRAASFVGLCCIRALLTHVARDDRISADAGSTRFTCTWRASTRKLSLYSSANNHLIGELIGLFVGCVLLRLLAGM